MMRTSLFKFLAFSGAFGLVFTSAQAVPLTYVGNDASVWDAPGNWNPQQIPTIDDDVIITGKTVKAVAGPITAKSISIGSGGRLHLGAASLAPQTIATIAEDLNVNAGAKLYVFAGALTNLTVFANALTNHSTATAALYANPTAVSIGGTFRVNAGGVVYPENDPLTGAAVFFKPKDFTLANLAEINTVNLGWGRKRILNPAIEPLPAGARFQNYSGNYTYSFGFGAGHEYAGSTGYGGNSTIKRTITYSTPYVTAYDSGYGYGNAYAPFLPSSPSGMWGNEYTRGSGSIVILATGSVTIGGRLNANCLPNMGYQYLGGPAGGGIWICGKAVSIAATAEITADGAQSRQPGYKAEGSGGRVAICDNIRPVDWETLAAATVAWSKTSVTTTLPSGFLAEPLYGEFAATASGAINATDVTCKGQNGTLVKVTSLTGKTILTTSGSPLNAVASGITYGDSTLDIDTQYVFTSPSFGTDPSNPTGIAYPCLGWVVSNSTEQVASGDSTTAVFTPTDDQDSYRLVWLWGEPQMIRTYRIDSPGGGTITVNDVVHEEDAVLPVEASSQPDQVTAVAKSGFRFLGWAGLPSGYTTNATATVPVEAGGVVTALFESEMPVLTTKTFVGGASSMWDDGANWSPAGVPTLSDDVVVNIDCLIPFAAIAHSITVGSSAALRLSASGTVTSPQADNSRSFAHRHLFVAGNLTIAGSAVFGGRGSAYTMLDIAVLGNVVLNGSAAMSVYAAPLDPDLASTPTNLYAAATRFYIGGNMTLNGTTKVYPYCDYYTGTAVRFESYDLTVAEGAAVDAESRGWNWQAYAGEPDENSLFSNKKFPAGSDKTTTYQTRALGAGDGYAFGAGYGGNGRYLPDNTKIHATYGHTYGSAHAPFMPGSQGGLYDNIYTPKAGGGSAWFKCRHKIRLDGTVVASATRYFYSGSAAGSVWLLARGFEAGSGARIAAVGGGTSDAQLYTAAGGGGRISLGLGLSDVEIDALAAGETPDTLAYSDAINLVTVDVSGGPDGTANGTKLPQTYAAAGTVSLVKGALADKSVAVQASPVAAGLPQPPYGVSSGTIGDVLHFQATDDANGYGADPSDPTRMRWRCTGYVVSNATEEVLNGTGLGCSFDLTIPETDISVTWIWETPERKFSVDNPQGTGYGRLRLGGEDFVSGTPVWCGYLAEYELEAVPEEGYEFLYWSGDFPYGQAKANPLTLTIDHARSIRPVFRRCEDPTTRARTASGKFEFLDESAWSGGNFPGTNDAVVIDNACSVAGVNYIEVGSLTMSNTNARLWIGTDSEIYTRNLDTTESNNTWTTDFPTRVNDAAEEIAVIVNGAAALSGGAQLVIGAPRSQRKAHGRLEAASLTLSGHSQALVTAGAIEGGFTFASGAGFIRTTGDLAVNDHAKLRPYSDGRTGGSVKIECGGDLTVAADAMVTAVGAGYAAYAETPSSQSPGYGYDYVIGGGYGGAGGCADLEHQSALTNFYGLVYGNRLAPVHPGAPNGTYNAPYMCGGGLIRVLCSGTISVAGTLTAAPQEVAFTETYFFGGAAGGGIWLAAKDFAFASGAAMDAHGGRATYGSAGGGGRIALCKYATGPDLETFAAGSEPLFGYACGGGRTEFETKFPGVTVNVAGGDEWSRTAPPHENLGKRGGDGTFAYIVPPQGMLILFK